MKSFVAVVSQRLRVLDAREANFHRIRSEVQNEKRKSQESNRRDLEIAIENVDRLFQEQETAEKRLLMEICFCCVVGNITLT
jgi:vacuolar-type H+-ATPase subunit E/Vma4